MIDRRRLIVLLCLTFASQAFARSGRYISLFNVVKFNNDRCTSNLAGSGSVTVGTTTTTPNREGVCYSKEECEKNKGRAQGTCASGFGVCCVFIVEASSTITQNCTYIRNDKFPAAATGTTAVKYTINKCSQDVCAIRLDFDTFSIAGPSDTIETNGGACANDALTISSSSRNNYPTICGLNTGQHVYIDVGRNTGDSATLDLKFTGTSDRKWDMKVTQVKCGDGRPDGCFQYFTGTSGQIKTFNFDAASGTHLANQRYSACIRQEAGNCCVRYRPCPGVTDAFSLFEATATNNNGRTDSLCTDDYLQIQGLTNTCSANAAPQTSRVCGTAFTNINGVSKGPGSRDIPLCDCTAPFEITVVTDATVDAAGQTRSRGACLEYNQVPCN